MILRDWREADPAAVRDCYERERQHWLDGSVLGHDLDLGHGGAGPFRARPARVSCR